MKRVLTETELEKFEGYLLKEEKSLRTVEKYLRDVGRFITFANGREIEKSTVIAYKTMLEKSYAVSSANTMLAALNGFFRFMEWHDLTVKQFKFQNRSFCPQDKELSREEYARLVTTALKQGNERLSLILQTVCSTGIRISELEYITAETVRRGETVVSCKGKKRVILLVPDLQKKLERYVRKNGIEGKLFVTNSGKPVCRTNVWREMKRLAADADVPENKVFPHNLRHLFARTFYSMDKDIVKLADILGHTNINTTRIYTVTTADEYKKKMEEMMLII
ncbi:MAG: tyrosine-type recombinase/integrase [Clostridia bacterium]|nr:tyrosine-type recombinase/integrase [Clostridia bacterium]